MALIKSLKSLSAFGTSGGSMHWAAGLSFGLKILGTGLAFGVQLLLARLMTVDDYGIYALAITWANALVVIAGFGMPMAAIRFVAEHQARVNLALMLGFVRFGYVLTIGSALLIAGALAAVILLIGDRFSVQALVAFLIAALIIPINALYVFTGSVLQALRRILQTEGPQQVLRPLFIVLGVGTVILVSGAGAIDAVAAMWITLAASCLVLVVMGGLLRRAIPKEMSRTRPHYEPRRWIAMGASFLVLLGSAFLNERTDVLMIGFLLGTGEAGIYSVASRNALLLAFGLASANALLGPLTARFNAREELAELQRIVTQGARIACLISFPAGLVLIGFGDWILGLFGDPYRAGYSPLVLLCVAQLGLAALGSVGGTLALTGHSRIVAQALLGGVAINVLLNLMLIPAFGQSGAGLATMLSVLGTNGLMVAIAWHRLGINTTVFRLEKAEARD